VRGRALGGIRFVWHTGPGFEANAEGLHLAHAQVLHAGGDEGRIQTTAQEYADRHITDQMRAHAVENCLPRDFRLARADRESGRTMLAIRA